MKPHKRGVVLVFVLAVLMLLSILTASYFTRVGEVSELASAVVGQQVADANANLGLQAAVAQVRTGAINVTALQPCPGAWVEGGVEPESCANRLPAPGPIVRGNAQSWTSGDGLLYRFVIVKPTPGPGIPPFRYIIQATGYYGNDQRSPNTITSILRAEIDVKTATGGGTMVGLGSEY